MKNRYLKFSLVLVFGLLVFGLSNVVFADNSLNQIVGADGKLSTINAQKITDNTGLSDRSVPSIIGTAIKVVLGLFGTIALGFVIWGGVTWLFSQGDPKKIGTARNRMVAAVVGLAIIAASYAITDFVISQISVVVG